MIYLDTSAMFKLLIAEDETEAMHRYFVDSPEDAPFISSMLLYTELMCAAGRRADADQQFASALCQYLTLVDVVKSDFLRAATAPWRIRGADALHIAVALRIGASSFVTYDKEQARAARMLGFEVVQPGVLSAS